MGILDAFKRSSSGVSINQSGDNVTITLADGTTFSNSDIRVTVDSALTVPAMWAGVNFLAGTMAGLPLNVYRKVDDSREKLKTSLQSILHDAVNDEMTSFGWRYSMFTNIFTYGRSLTYIERDSRGHVQNLFHLDPEKVKIRRESGKTTYEMTNNFNTKVYKSSEIIDIPLMLKSDMVTHVNPIVNYRDTIGMALAVTRYGSKFFAGGGVPMFALLGSFTSPAGIKNASKDVNAAIEKSLKENKNMLTLPSGHEIKQLGSDPDKNQMIETQRFLIEQFARLFSLPPVFLQDLTHGTFSNTEQQDIHLVKHIIKRWVEQVEQELNLKLLGRKDRSRYVEFNVDSLLRGDFKTRMLGYASGIQNGILKPNEVRARENMPSDEYGDKLMIQGATVPIQDQQLLYNGENVKNDVSGETDNE